MSFTFKVGDATIHRVVEMETGFTPILEFFPNLTKERLEENRSWMQPAALDANDNVVLCFQSYIVQIGGKNILVDSCVGNDKPREARPLWNKKKDWAFQNGFAAAGLTYADIDFVMCTHLHVDHVGWNTRMENGRWVPTFPKARYLFSKTELDFWLAENAKAEVGPIADSVVPIVEAKACDVISSDYQLNDLVKIFPTPGHTIDHYAVEVGGKGTRSVFTGDLIHSPIQARHPELAMRIDYDPAQGVASRRKFLETYCDTDAVCCFAHFPSPSKGYVRRWGDGFKCEYIA